MNALNGINCSAFYGLHLQKSTTPKITQTLKIYSKIALLTLVLGIISLIYMIKVEGEPGALPLLLILVGSVLLSFKSHTKIYKKNNIKANTSPIEALEITPKKFAKILHRIKSSFGVIAFVILISGIMNYLGLSRHHQSWNQFVDSHLYITFIYSVILLAIYYLNEKYKKYIYKYSIDKNQITLYFINGLARKNLVTIPISSLKKVKFRKIQSEVWFHFSDHIESYYFYEDWLGERFYENIPVEKI